MWKKESITYYVALMFGIKLMNIQLHLHINEAIPKHVQFNSKS